MSMLKLDDCQVCTLVHILYREPAVPRDLDKFPTIQMFLREGVVQKTDEGRLTVNPDCAELQYSYVFPRDIYDRLGSDRSFDEMDQAGVLERGEYERKYSRFDLLQLCHDLWALEMIMLPTLDGVLVHPDNPNRERGHLLAEAWQDKYNQ